MQLLDPVRATIRRHDLIRPGMRVLAALSGGPDSVALTHLCRELHEAGDLVLVGVAHLNHQLRDGAADDAAFCARLAASLDVHLESGAMDVAGLAAERGLSIETAAHDARYAFLRAAAANMGADRVALGHTLDDQAETVLLRLLRGAGSRGLAGMYPRNGLFVRPLLDIRREALRAFLEESRLPFRDDPTNADRRIPRNRVRAELLPWLAREFNPRIVHLLGQQAELSRDEWDWLNAAVDDLLRSALRGQLPEWTLRVEPLLHAHPAVARAALRRVMEQAAGGRPITLPHVTAAMALCTADADGSADFPGHRLERRAAHVVLRSGHPRRERPAETVEPTNFFRYPLSIPGEVRIPEASATISAAIRPAGSPTVSAGRDEVALRLGPDQAREWSVRSRKAGDRVTLPGLTGRKKVQDLFVDRKVPRGQRDRVPLVVDANDRVVWVVGHAVAGEFRVTDPAQAVLVLRLKLWGGSA